MGWRFSAARRASVAVRSNTGACLADLFTGLLRRGGPCPGGVHAIEAGEQVKGFAMAWIGKALGGSGIAAVAATSMTALLVIVGAVLLVTLAALWVGREAARSPTDDAARRWAWLLHGHDPGGSGTEPVTDGGGLPWLSTDIG
jgi:hypothetical protein